MGEKEPKLSSGDKALLRTAQTGEGAITVTPEIFKQTDAERRRHGREIRA